ncbi:hypothetical protein COCON_G00134430 [Conger conger]|uniref:Uncharacterized protein n=1 Tax=Conger conger TaxID=82655 RepID=A0A9Q1HXH4_CONCO|nr:hypothetical protein COCON_G00134430 [Conger conger]
MNPGLEGAGSAQASITETSRCNSGRAQLGSITIRPEVTVKTADFCEGAPCAFGGERQQAQVSALRADVPRPPITSRYSGQASSSSLEALRGAGEDEDGGGGVEEEEAAHSFQREEEEVCPEYREVIGGRGTAKLQETPLSVIWGLPRGPASSLSLSVSETDPALS